MITVSITVPLSNAEHDLISGVHPLADSRRLNTTLGGLRTIVERLSDAADDATRRGLDPSEYLRLADRLGAVLVHPSNAEEV